ncbi:MAG: hypothetical protein OXC19_14240, partial [Bryobacterales bacterium]|nr:hypothetical protein [Bryobacterales bacterium]
VGMPTADAFAAIRGSRAFLQGKVPGATSTKGPAAHARAVWGGAPAPLLLRPSCAGRPAQIRNSLLNKAMARPRVFRRGAKRASRVHGECFVAAFSPKQRTIVPRPAGPQPPWGKRAL